MGGEESSLIFNRFQLVSLKYLPRLGLWNLNYNCTLLTPPESLTKPLFFPNIKASRVYRI